MVKILVTGAAGFIGSHLAEYLNNRGYSVVGIDDLSGGYLTNVPKGIRFHKLSINDVKGINALFRKEKFDLVFHLAAYAAEGLSHFMRKFNYENNLIGSVNLINASVNFGVKRFIFTSSMATYGANKTPLSEDMIPHPEDPYGISKYAVEQELRCAHDLFGLDYVIIRPHNVMGPHQNLYDKYRNVVGIFMNQIMMGKPPTIFGDGQQTRAFSYIKDVVPCIAKAGFIPEVRGEIINVGAAEQYTINQLAEEVCKAMKTDLKPIHLPPRYEVKHAFCTTEKSVRLLGYKQTYTLQQGLQEMADWAKKMGPKKPKKWKRYEIEKNIPETWLR
jgi:UDP-glucose 4-epimerase